VTSFAELTTFRIGGSIGAFAMAESDAEIIEAARDGAMFIGGGSNLLVSDDACPQTVVRIATMGIEVQRDGDRVIVEAAAGESWDDLVLFAVENGWSGIEAMSGIPGLVGATPIQNVGAYGQDVSQVISHLSVLDTATMQVESLTGADCSFAYRGSRFKGDDRFVILSAAFALHSDATSTVRYAELANALEVSIGDDAEAADVRDAVLALRRGKGMVIDPSDADTRSAGSFFTNPIVTAEQATALDGSCPRYPSATGVKLSAAWLIEQAGITKGWSLDGRARVSTKHTLALVNGSGDASAADVIELARAIRDRVQDAFGVTLEVEPRLVGCEL
jgi:UDP-N-acetylmuramate dehydrogenase